MSDNGATIGNGSTNAPLKGTKSTLFEGGIRTPLLIRWPAVIAPNTVIEQPAISLDLLPTALAAAKISPSSEHPLDGVNLLPLLTGQSNAVPHKQLFWKFGDQWAVRNGNWKLVHSGRPRGEFATQLVNLEIDPSEEQDLSAENPAIRKELQELWKEWDKNNVPAKWGK